jgi:hypothetical protein
VLVALALAGLLAASARAATRVLLRDDFDGSALDAAKWLVPTGPGTFFGRTQVRPPSVPLVVSGGVIRLQLDTWNPSAQVPGDSFFGSEIDTLETFARGSGLEFEARLRLVGPLPRGLVGSLFSFVFLPPDRRDEIDFELLSNDLDAGLPRVLTNVFDDDDFSQPGDKAFATLAGLDLASFHSYTVRWLPDRVEWWIDGTRVRQELVTLPDDAMNVRLNFWAPDSFFSEAYDASLQPAANAQDNQVYFYEVDWVEIRRVEAAVPAVGPPGLWLLALAIALAGTLALRHRPGYGL